MNTTVVMAIVVVPIIYGTIKKYFGIVLIISNTWPHLAT